MDIVKFYGDWIFYGGVLGLVIAGIWTYILEKKYSPYMVPWKQHLILISVCIIPTIVLPFWLSPAVPIWGKIGGTGGITLYSIIRYILATKYEIANFMVCTKCGKRFFKEKAPNECSKCGGVIKDIAEFNKKKSMHKGSKIMGKAVGSGFESLIISKDNQVIMP